MDYVLELGFDGPGFVAVPNAVVDMDGLSADALGVLVYLARLAGGRGAAIVRVGAVRSRFGIGEDKWQRIARELRAVGAISDNFGRTSDGRSIVRSLVVGWPKVQAKTRTRENPGHTSRSVKTCEPENPGESRENPGHLTGKTPALKKDTESACRAAISGKARHALREDEGEAGTVARAKRAAIAASVGLPFIDADGKWQPARRVTA